MPTVTTPAPQSALPGPIMAREMAEQTAVLRRILDDGAPAIRKVAQEIAARALRFVLLTARSASGNAALYATYLPKSGRAARPGQGDGDALSRGGRGNGCGGVLGRVGRGER
ncbi:hypothetical protein AQJ46_05260 [Streptomyces canus]|uniref:Uncharacterized protein n=1 Tax=Streptomyces canus TaxID=58343 RepID=A0A101SH51_9ACTN|nr:hypothetical protein AQJ46_05260 [Streptomyces canus]